MPTNNLTQRILTGSKLTDKFWVDYLTGLSDQTKVTWYHSSGFDLRPLMVKRALSNWHHLGGKENRELREIGAELHDSILIYSDLHPAIYYSLLEVWKAKTEHDEHRFNLALRRPLRDDTQIFCWNLLDSIEPFNVFVKEDRNAASNIIPFAQGGDKPNQRNRRQSDNNANDREYDGFLIKLAWFDGSSELFDTIIFFCRDDESVGNLLRNESANVGCLFDKAAGTSGGESGLGFEYIFQNAEDVKSLKYIFTDLYEYRADSGKLLLMEKYFRLLFEHHLEYEVKYLIRGINIKPAVQPSPRDVVGHGGPAFCLARRLY